MRKLLCCLGIALVVLGSLGACGDVSTRAPSPGAPPLKKWDFTLGHLAAIPRGDYHPDQVPAIGDDGTIYAGGSLSLYALRPDGTEKWHHDSVAQSSAYPIHFALIDDSGDIWFDETSTVTGGVARVGPDGKGGDVAAISAASQIGSAYDGTVYMGTSVSMLQLTAGSARSEIKWQGFGSGFAFTQDGVIYITSGMKFFATDANHSLKWAKEIPAGGCEAPVLGADGTIYVGRNAALDAFNPDGTAKWSFSVEVHAAAPTIAKDGTIYFGSDDKNLYALSADGRLKWKFATGARVRSSAAITQSGTIYFGGVDGNLYALDAQGKLRWKFAAGGQVFSPTIGTDRTIYVQSADGKIYAIKDAQDNGGLSGQWPKYGGGVRNTARGAH